MVNGRVGERAKRRMGERAKRRMGETVNRQIVLSDLPRVPAVLPFCRFAVSPFHLSSRRCGIQLLDFLAQLFGSLTLLFDYVFAGPTNHRGIMRELLRDARSLLLL